MRKLYRRERNLSIAGEFLKKDYAAINEISAFFIDKFIIIASSEIFPANPRRLFLPRPQRMHKNPEIFRINRVKRRHRERILACAGLDRETGTSEFLQKPVLISGKAGRIGHLGNAVGTQRGELCGERGGRRRCTVAELPVYFPPLRVIGKRQ